MNAYQIQIIKAITEYLQDNPDQRFGQVLFNLNITHFASSPPELDHYLLRDIYNDSDETILNRISKKK